VYSCCGFQQVRTFADLNPTLATTLESAVALHPPQGAWLDVFSGFAAPRAHRVPSSWPSSDDYYALLNGLEGLAVWWLTQTTQNREGWHCGDLTNKQTNKQTNVTYSSQREQANLKTENI